MAFFLFWVLHWHFILDSRECPCIIIWVTWMLLLVFRRPAATSPVPSCCFTALYPILAYKQRILFLYAKLLWLGVEDTQGQQTSQLCFWSNYRITLISVFLDAQWKNFLFCEIWKRKACKIASQGEPDNSWSDIFIYQSPVDGGLPNLHIYLIYI